MATDQSDYKNYGPRPKLLREEGFQVSTPAELFDMLDSSNRGEQFFAETDGRSAAGASVSMGKLSPEVSARIEKAAKVKPESLFPVMGKGNAVEFSEAMLKDGIKNYDTGKTVKAPNTKYKDRLVRNSRGRAVTRSRFGGLLGKQPRPVFAHLVLHGNAEPNQPQYATHILEAPAGRT